MENYIGVKQIKAIPCTKAEYQIKFPRRITNEDLPKDSEGYLVEYPDANGSFEISYKSWSPKDVFEAAYRKTDGLTFGLALEAAKLGKCIARAGWNGKGMFVFMCPAHELTPDFIIEKVKSLPQSVKNYFKSFFHGETRYAGGDEIKVKFTPYLCMKAADQSIFNGWTPNMLDTLAEDWTIVEND